MWRRQFSFGECGVGRNASYSARGLALPAAARDSDSEDDGLDGETILRRASAKTAVLPERPSGSTRVRVTVSNRMGRYSDADVAHFNHVCTATIRQYCPSAYVEFLRTVDGPVAVVSLASETFRHVGSVAGHLDGGLGRGNWTCAVSVHGESELKLAISASGKGLRAHRSVWSWRTYAVVVVLVLFALLCEVVVPVVRRYALDATRSVVAPLAWGGDVGGAADQ